MRFGIGPNNVAMVQNCFKGGDHVGNTVDSKSLLAVSIHHTNREIRHSAQHRGHTCKVLLEKLLVDGHASAQAANVGLSVAVKELLHELNVVEHEELSTPLSDNGK